MRGLTLVLAFVAGSFVGALVAARVAAARVRKLTGALDEIATLDRDAAAPSFGTDPSQRVAEHLRMRLQEARGERQVREQILSSMDEGVLLFDADGGLLYANPAAELLLGERPASDHRLRPEALRRALEAVAATRHPDSAEMRIGEPPRWLRASVLPAGDSQLLLVLQDVTEARRVEAMRRDFVANASHELKTPAASIQAAAETIRTAIGDDPPVVPRFAEQLERDTLRLSRIVEDLLDLSRLESGSEHTDSVALDAIALEETARHEEAARLGGVTLHVDARAVPTISGSSRDLALLVRNLVDNAVRYTKPGGRVDVDIRPEPATVVLVVRDTGIGIPRRDLSRIFERFYRVDRARSRETGGTGLGLSIVRHVAENHGGTVEVESELGGGTAFTVRLPAA